MHERAMCDLVERSVDECALEGWHGVARLLQVRELETE
jgi:hypothetical protein